MLGNAKTDVISYLLLSSSAEPGIGYLSLGHLVACCKGGYVPSSTSAPL